MGSAELTAEAPMPAGRDLAAERGSALASAGAAPAAVASPTAPAVAAAPRSTERRDMRGDRSWAAAGSDDGSA